MSREFPVEGSGEKKPKPDLIVLITRGVPLPFVSNKHNYSYEGALKSEGNVVFRTGYCATELEALNKCYAAAKDSFHLTDGERNQLPIARKENPSEI